MNTQSTYRTAFLSAALSTLALIGTAQVLAGELSTTRSIRVGYADLDIASSAGAASLYRRIKGAARDVCGYQGHSLVEIKQWQLCVQGAVADAVATVNSPLLTAMHSSKDGHATVTAMLSQ